MAKLSAVRIETRILGYKNSPGIPSLAAQAGHGMGDTPKIAKKIKEGNKQLEKYYTLLGNPQFGFMGNAKGNFSQKENFLAHQI